MDHFNFMVIALLLGLASGFIGGIATGGGMISIPGLIFIGLPPASAIATNILTISASLTSAFRYHQSNIIQRRYTLPFIWLSLLGGIAGSNLLLHIDGQVMQKVFGAVLLLLTIIKSAKRSSPSTSSLRTHKSIGLVLIFLTDVFAGLFGTGGGIFMVYILSYFYGMTVTEANANAKIIGLGGAAAMVATFLHAGIINFSLGIPLMMGSAVGGYIGAHIALKRGEEIVEAIFFLIVLASALKLLI